MDTHRVKLPLADLPPGEVRQVRVGDLPVCVANAGGDIYAVSDTCTHANISLSSGSLIGRQVVCPWHHAMFDLKTGRATCGPAVDPLRSYQIHIQDDTIVIEQTPAPPLSGRPDRAPPPSPPPAMKTIPITIDDPINKRILAISEDKVQGFERYPLNFIAEQSGVEIDTVIERIRAMLEAGTIRRVRQTLMSTSLAPGALVAWQVPPDKLNDAFEYMFRDDPFSGHVVIRSTDQQTAGSQYRLWTTLKVPVGYSMPKHADYLMRQVGAEKYKLLPAEKLFALGVGHVRRRGMEPGARTDEPARVMDTTIVELTDHEWRVLMALKDDFASDEITENIWAPRARRADVPLEEFFEVAERLNERRVIGRFSTFLEHVKKLKDGSTVTKYNALFHWAVPEGKQMEAGLEVGRHHIMTHAYWREGGPDFKNVNVMGVAHGTEKETVLAHKAAIDEHLREAGIDILYTNVFWGGRSEIKPSEISPIAYRQWCEREGIEPETMRP